MTNAPDTPPTILVVEDEALVAMLIEDGLAYAGQKSLGQPTQWTKH